MVEHPELPGQAVEYGNLLRRVALHDLGVLVEGRLPAHLVGKEGDVVGHEAVHRRRRTFGGSVEGSLDVVPTREAIVLVQDAEQLRVRVRVLLTGVRVGRIHEVAHMRHHAAAAVRRLVLRPLRHRIAQVLAEHAFERLAVPGPVQVSEEVVQGAVLEEHDNHVIHRVRTVLCCHCHSLSGNLLDVAAA